ncbi:MAG: ankyrin repeat domain-containing protein, partial [Planctomycetota bacterium]
GAKINVNVKYQGGWTLLHDVAWGGQVNATKLLLDLGADVNAKTEKGHTPMDVALDMSYRQVIDILNSAGGQFGIRKNVGRGWIK